MPNEEMANANKGWNLTMPPDTKPGQPCPLHPELMVRLEAIEKGQQESRKIQHQILDAVCGSIDGTIPGHRSRIEALEATKKQALGLGGWAVAFLTGLVASALTVIMTKLFG
jgi:hypothetical protein